MKTPDGQMNIPFQRPEDEIRRSIIAKQRAGEKNFTEDELEFLTKEREDAARERREQHGP